MLCSFFPLVLFPFPSLNLGKTRARITPMHTSSGVSVAFPPAQAVQTGHSKVAGTYRNLCKSPSLVELYRSVPATPSPPWNPGKTRGAQGVHATRYLASPWPSLPPRQYKPANPKVPGTHGTRAKKPSLVELHRSVPATSPGTERKAMTHCFG